jgi:hypothetical protein
MLFAAFLPVVAASPEALVHPAMDAGVQLAVMMVVVIVAVVGTMMVVAMVVAMTVAAATRAAVLVAGLAGRFVLDGEILADADGEFAHAVLLRTTQT